MGASRRIRAGGRAQRDGVHGVESERSEREGLYRLSRVLRGCLVADGALVRRSRRTSRRPHPRAHRLSDWTGIHQSSRRLPRGARGGDRGDRPSTQDHAALATHRERAARTRARAHAVRIRADSCGPPSGAERRGTDRVQRPHRRRVHLLRQDRAPADGERQSRSVRKAESLGASGALLRTARDVVAVLRVAMAARSARDAGSAADRTRGALPRAGDRWWCHALAARPRIVLVLRPARVHRHVRARLLHELQVRRVTGARAVRCRARGARSGLLLPVELFGLERLGRAGTRRRVACRCRARRTGAALDGHGADPRLRPASPHRQLARGLARWRVGDARVGARHPQLGRAVRHPHHRR